MSPVSVSCHARVTLPSPRHAVRGESEVRAPVRTEPHQTDSAPSRRTPNAERRGYWLLIN